VRSPKMAGEDGERRKQKGQKEATGIVRIEKRDGEGETAGGKCGKGVLRHRILLRPLPAHTLRVLLVLFVMLCNVRRERVVWVRRRQQGLYRE
jgi:hypothetical protein